MSSCLHAMIKRSIFEEILNVCDHGPFFLVCCLTPPGEVAFRKGWFETNMKQPQPTCHIASIVFLVP